MKLSELKGEDALEAFAELLEPVALILSDKDVLADIQADKPHLLIVKKLLKNHKKEVIQIMAVMNQKDAESYEPSFTEIPATLFDLLNDKNITSLFTSQSQNSGLNNSGSAMENTEASVI